MSKFPKLKVEKRTLHGRKVKQLRRQGMIPANLFGKSIDSQSIQLSEKDFSRIFSEVGETGLVEVVLGEKVYPSLVTAIAKNPVTAQILHADFHTVSLKDKVTATIPVHMTGEAPAIKEVGGVINLSLHEIEVEALPTDLPESITVDVGSLKAIGDAIMIKDLKLGEKVEIKIEPDMIIVSIAEPAKEEVVVVEEAPKEAEVIGKAEEPTSEEAPKS